MGFNNVANTRIALVTANDSNGSGSLGAGIVRDV